MRKKLQKKIFPIIDRTFRWVDKKHIRRTRNIKLIPSFINRRGGKVSYAEWAHVIGIFQTIIYQNLKKKTGNHILDIGCGTGLIGISSEPFINDSGNYTGLDVIKNDIDFCSSHFNTSKFSFIHLDVLNPTYAADQNEVLKPWPIKDESRDLVAALSVWTHLNEKDARFYFNEIHRVLRKGGKAIITFFILDNAYYDSLSSRDNKASLYHSTNQNLWVFDKNAYDSKDWYSAKWTKNPEDAIGITLDGLNLLCSDSKLKLIKHYPGSWKEQAGVYFQDILIFEK